MVRQTETRPMRFPRIALDQTMTFGIIDYHLHPCSPTPINQEVLSHLHQADVKGFLYLSFFYIYHFSL